MNDRDNDQTLEAALENLIHEITPLTETETVTLDKAHGRILREDIHAPIAVPLQDTAAVDGYAFYHDDLTDMPLPVRGHIRAGHPLEGAAPRGAAYRIFTGAPMPDGPDSVAMEEFCIFDENGRVTLPDGIRKGANFRPMGENVAKGEKIISAGTRLGPSEIGLAAAVGVTRLKVTRRLRVGLLSMGDEIHETGAAAGNTPGQLHDSNRPMLSRMLAADGHEVIDLGIIPDNRDKLADAYRDAVSRADLVISSGGSSAGEEDHARPAIEANGGRISFWRLAIKPGRPMAVGWIDNKPLFCLPGNPVAAFVCFRLLITPAVTAFQGGAVPAVMKLPLPARFSHSNKQRRAQYLRARIVHDEDGQPGIAIHGRAGAGVLSSLAGADGLVEIPRDCAEVKDGDMLAFIPFREAAL